MVNANSAGLVCWNCGGAYLDQSDRRHSSLERDTLYDAHSGIMSLFTLLMGTLIVQPVELNQSACKTPPRLVSDWKMSLEMKGCME